MSKGRKFQLYGVALIFFATLFLAHSTTGISGSETSRFAVIQMVGERGVFHIEESVFKTVDKVVFNNHIYSDKPPFLPWTAGVIYGAVYRLGGASFAENKSSAVLRTNFIFGVIFNSAIFLLLFQMLRRSRRGSLKLKFLIAMSAIFCTWILSYNTMFNNHTPAAFMLLLILCLLESYSRCPSPLKALCAGLAAGGAGAFELPLGGIAGALTVIAIFAESKREFRIKNTFCTIGGGLIVLFGITLLNFYACGSWLPLYIAGNGSYTPPGVIREDLGKYIIDTLFYTRGLFSYQPLLLLAIPGMWFMRKKYSAGVKIFSFVTILTIFFYIAFTNEYGGWGYGFRYLIPLLPLLVYFAGMWIFTWKIDGVKRAVLGVLLLWGFTSAAAGTFMPYCVAYEAFRTPEGHFTEAIQSTFAGNMLCIVHRVAPHSELKKAFERYYGKKNTDAYIFWSFFNRDLPDENAGFVSRQESLKILKDRE